VAINKPLLRKVRKLIADEPRRLHMGTWGRKLQKSERTASDAPPCGTVACLAGWTVLASRPESEWPKLFYRDGNIRSIDQMAVSAKAAELLRINYAKAMTIFRRTEWGSKQVLHWIDRQLSK
jgi:hypothetical protein